MQAVFNRRFGALHLFVSLVQFRVLMLQRFQLLVSFCQKFSGHAQFFVLAFKLRFSRSDLIFVLRRLLSQPRDFLLRFLQLFI